MIYATLSDMTDARQTDIERLNAFLRGERAAVETYSQCIDDVTSPAIVTQLRLLGQCHQLRVTALAERIASLGGSPVHSSGLWGHLAKMVQGGAGLLGDSAALAALERGEQLGSGNYNDIDDLSVETRQFVHDQLIPKQQHSYAALRHMKGVL
jgi:demethoxyubiquinone hydroxylase (CLK1/Coq7/Cat5 family)